MKRIIATIVIMLVIQASLIAIGFITVTSQYLPNQESSYYVLIAEIDKQGNMAYTDTWLVRYVTRNPKLAMVISYYGRHLL